MSNLLEVLNKVNQFETPDDPLNLKTVNYL